MKESALTLYELNTQIKELLKKHAAPSYWLIAEISELKVNYSGHCYLELIQKEENGEHIIANSRATIWAQNYNLIKAYFETTTGHSLIEGLKILVKVRIEFHEVYRLSLNIIDIEPTYTVGELAIRKQKIIDQLTAEGVLEMNRELYLPEACQRIAIISSSTAAGFGDFINQLENNTNGFKFYFKLFPAVMQGEAAEQSIINALDRVYQYESFFDAVVLIRGGGGKADLNCFNSYNLAYYITQFPLPVLTGIGHEQDDSVTDMVAHTRLKTPTAVAAFLVNRLAELEYRLDEVIDEIKEQVYSNLQQQGENLNNISYALRHGFTKLLHAYKTQLYHFSNFLANGIRRALQRENKQLTMYQSQLALLPGSVLDVQHKHLTQVSDVLYKVIRHNFQREYNKLEYQLDKVRILNPDQILKRGYSITRVNGNVLKSCDLVNKGDEIETILWKGEILSTIKSKRK